MEQAVQRRSGAMNTNESEVVERAVGELEVLAKLIPTLADPTGSFVGEISSILRDCLQIRRELWKHYSNNQHIMTLFMIGGWAQDFLARDLDDGRALLGYKWSLYTPGERMNAAPVIMYPRNWYEEHRDTRILDVSAQKIMDELCKVLSTTNIVLYISNNAPSTYPPWKFDGFLKKRLADSDLPKFIGNYYWGLQQTLPASQDPYEYSVKFHGPLSAKTGTSGLTPSATNNLALPRDSVRTSEKQQKPWNTETATASTYMRANVMEIDRTTSDNLTPKFGGEQLSFSSNLPVVDNKRRRYEVIQRIRSLVIHKIVPAEGSILGGTEVTLLGSGFYQGLEVMFGDTEATTTTFWGEKCLNCIAPPASQVGIVTVKFKHEHHNYTQMQQPAQSGPVFTYFDDHTVEMYRVALKTLGNTIQHPTEGSHSVAAQQLAMETSSISPTRWASKLSSVAMNLGMMGYLAECLAAPNVHPVETNQLLGEVGYALMSLSNALSAQPLEDDTILSAILLWFVERAWDHQDKAEAHWKGVRILMQCRPDFDIARPLTRCLQTSLLLATHSQSEMNKVCQFVSEVFRSAVEDTSNASNIGQSMVVASAPTPAMTVDSPWSETDAAPPPYMLSPTPLNQACVIYASVNVRR